MKFRIEKQIARYFSIESGSPKVQNLCVNSNFASMITHSLKNTQFLLPTLFGYLARVVRTNQWLFCFSYCLRLENCILRSIPRIVFFMDRELTSKTALWSLFNKPRRNHLSCLSLPFNYRIERSNGYFIYIEVKIFSLIFSALLPLEFHANFVISIYSTEQKFSRSLIGIHRIEFGSVFKLKFAFIIYSKNTF